ncbi:hypothetical protein Cni_G12999 [Canna indica]|uniref:DUF4283 domain-containing protein n=1 Tax=Canna indica TaxID=4628 RepID=A0AAQ3K8U3_9LILI|nr:hypothetical protein Cni_G12999 [Canna indica]
MHLWVISLELNFFLNLWVKIHNLPLEFWSASVIRKIIGRLGKPLYMDKHTTTKSRIGYARICIEMEIGVGLVDSPTFTVRNEKYEIQLEYEWKPSRCTRYSIFGHTDNKRPSLAKKMTSLWVPKKLNTNNNQMVYHNGIIPSCNGPK